MLFCPEVNYHFIITAIRKPYLTVSKLGVQADCEMENIIWNNPFLPWDYPWTSNYSMPLIGIFRRGKGKKEEHEPWGESLENVRESQAGWKGAKG
jgi:hypothetical protein